ncbi:MAG: hypothetical protein IPM29_25100 [Planctomycetes bacterium]|nr:hypothetical protein [Planctomycetota bacterium]
MTSPASGYVGTDPQGGQPSDVFAISISGSTVTETQLDTTPTAGPNLGQIAVVGSSLYFCTQNSSYAGGYLQRVPATGGVVTTVRDLTLLPGWSGSANACCALGSNVYVASFDWSTLPSSPGCLVEHDTTRGTTRVLMAFPSSRYPSGAGPHNLGVVHMQAYGSRLILIGVYGDKVTVDPVTAAVVTHVYSGANLFGPGPAPNMLNSGDLDLNTGDLIVGTRDGYAERVLADGSAAEEIIAGVGSAVPAYVNSVTGTSHLQATTAATDFSYGSGCEHRAGRTLCDVAAGLPTAGNLNYRLGCYSSAVPSVAVLIALGPQLPPIDLGPLGAPGCVIHIANIVLSIPATAASGAGSTGFATFSATVPFPIPGGVAGASVYRQWVELDPFFGNPLGLTVSNARRMDIR